MKFIDEVRVRVKAGDGGHGAVAFRREKFVPKGGPAGGDGGKGADVVLEVDEGLSTLLDYRYKHDYKAPAGENGMPKDKYGRGGSDLVLRVPPGTQVYDEDTGQLVADLRAHKQRLVLAQGGRGGRGNIHFATPTERAPRRAEDGWPGEERSVRLELKLLADVGIVGFPNAGKSSMISRISAARPKVADYPFTTLVPNLGVVGLSDDRSFVVADVPGLIPGAHSGAGLGHRFLRHIERTRVLLFLLSWTEEPGRSPLSDYETLLTELSLYDSEIARRPAVVALNKSDLPETRESAAELQEVLSGRGQTLHVVSAAAGHGVREMLEGLWVHLEAARRKAQQNTQQEPTEGAGQLGAEEAKSAGLQPQEDDDPSSAPGGSAPSVV